MRVYNRFLVILLLIGVVGVGPVRAEDYSLTFLFGPGFAATARQGARAAALSSHKWFASTNASVELRRAGSMEGQPVDSKMTLKDLESAFTEAATAARAADPAAFLSSLDAAVQAAALRPGTRLLIAVLNAPPLSSEMEKIVENLVGLCQRGAVRVVVLDIVEPGAKTVPSPLEVLSKNTGGAWVHQANELEEALLSVKQTAVADGKALAAPKTAAAAPAEPATARAAASEAPAPSAEPSAIPVRARFIRTSHTAGPVTLGIESVVGSGSNGGGTGTGVSMNERAFEANESGGPMFGMILAESPLDSLKFQVDDTAGTYLARARIIVLVRNAKGAPVWSGQKDVEIHGPLRDLDLRKKGNLEFLRGLTVPGRSGLTIDAKVEDLLAGASGRIETPLLAGEGAPGLMASDVMFVRPFHHSMDRFESDEILAYEGEALSPVLNPVFQSSEEPKFQLYLVIYPDLHGAQPQLSLELARGGHVVVRMPMQFKSSILDWTREGGSGAVGQNAMVGGQAHAFPYLADIKSTKLSAGDYDAIVTIRQGKSTLTRVAPFRVVGDRPPVKEAATQQALVRRPEPEDGVVVLPEIEPATVDSSGLAMPQSEQKRLWEEAAANAREYSSHLPNFRCTEETHRFTAATLKPEDLKETDSYRNELTFEEGRETYRVIEINGVRTEASLQDLSSKTAYSKGEFGSMLMGLFAPEVGTAYKWAGRAMAMGVICQVFEISVPRSRSNFSLRFNRASEPAGYTGRLFIDDETGLVRRLTIEGNSLPPTFPLQSPSFSLEYGMVRIGQADYLLPLRSTMQVRQGKNFVRNEAVFREYRRFEASSGIKFDNQ